MIGPGTDLSKCCTACLDFLGIALCSPIGPQYAYQVVVDVGGHAHAHLQEGAFQADVTLTRMVDSPAHERAVGSHPTGPISPGADLDERVIGSGLCGEGDFAPALHVAARA